MDDFLADMDILETELVFLKEKGVIDIKSGHYCLNQDFITLLEEIKKLTCAEDIH